MEPESDDAASEPLVGARSARMRTREQIVAYHHDDNMPLSESPWTLIWMQHIRAKFILRTQEASRNLPLRLCLLELLRAAGEVL